MKPHLFPFLRPMTDEKELNSLYQQVVTTMLEVHNSKEPQILSQLWYVGASILWSYQSRACMLHSKRVGGEVSSMEHYTLRKILWLATYYDFYDKKVI